MSPEQYSENLTPPDNDPAESCSEIPDEPLEYSLELATALYESGKSLVQIGYVFDLNHGTIWNALRRAGVEMRSPHQSRRSQS